MPQLAPIMWTFLFTFMWMMLFSWVIFEWSKSSKSFKTLIFSNLSSNIHLKLWSW